MPFSEAYICFFINPFYSILIPCLYKFRSGYANYSIFFLQTRNMFLVFQQEETIFLPHLTEASIWVKVGFPQKTLHMTNFKIAMGIVLDHFGPKNGKILIYFISRLNNSIQEDFFVCTLIFSGGSRGWGWGAHSKFQFASN